MFLEKNSLDNFSEWLTSLNDSGGFCLIDKDIDWTSFDVCGKIRGITHIKKVGHAGTLDPFATGLLIVAVGKTTKRISEFQDLDKTYKGTIKIGATTITYDREAEEENLTDFSSINPEDILEMRKQFLGKILQTPPIFSAKKVKGKPLYMYARRNQEVEIKPAEVEVLKFDITEINLPFIDFEIVCTKGTYIRSIANDLGEKLGTGGYLHSLRRTAIGSVSVDNALTIKEFQELFVQI